MKISNISLVARYPDGCSKVTTMMECELPVKFFLRDTAAPITEYREYSLGLHEAVNSIMADRERRALRELEKMKLTKEK
jgi:hypothetical protein